MYTVSVQTPWSSDYLVAAVGWFLMKGQESVVFFQKGCDYIHNTYRKWLNRQYNINIKQTDTISVRTV